MVYGTGRSKQSWALCLCHLWRYFHILLVQKWASSTQTDFAYQGEKTGYFLLVSVKCTRNFWWLQLELWIWNTTQFDSTFLLALYNICVQKLNQCWPWWCFLTPKTELQMNVSIGWAGGKRKALGFKFHHYSCMYRKYFFNQLSTSSVCTE